MEIAIYALTPEILTPTELGSVGAQAQLPLSALHSNRRTKSRVGSRILSSKDLKIQILRLNNKNVEKFNDFALLWVIGKF